MNNRIQKSDLYGPSNGSRAHQECSRILTAAVINMQFRNLLLSNPGQAIERGYGGEAFALAREEKRRVAEIKATSLADFASQLNQVLNYGVAAAAD